MAECVYVFPVLTSVWTMEEKDEKDTEIECNIQNHGTSLLVPWAEVFGIV